MTRCASPDTGKETRPDMHHQNRNRALHLALVAALAAVPLGCGDGPICASEIVVVIASMQSGDDIDTDTSPDPGVQIDVPVRSNLKQGDTVTLTVMDAGGQAVATREQTSDANGDVLFQAVDVPPGPVTLRVEGSTRDCGSGTDQIQINVTGAAACVLIIREGPLANDFYAPLPVLNTTNDSDGSLPGFQANIDIATSPGYGVELFVLDVASGVETSAGTVGADDQGLAWFPLTLAEGRQVLWAECASSSGTRSASSGNTSVFVDTEAPACDLVYPTAGTTIIPAMDIDGDPGNGTQIALTGTAAGNDIEDEIAIFIIDGMEYEGSPLDASGQSMVEVSFNDAGSYELGFRITDHAGNTCSVSRTHDYVTDGCSIEYIAPQGVVTSDSNGDPTDGLQTEVQVQIDVACVGRTVTTDCGLGTTTTTVPEGGLTTIEVTLCADAICETSDACTISVSNAAGVVTSVGTTIVADTQPPNVDLQFVNPVIACGDTVAASVDRDGDPGNGVQIDVRVVSPLAASRSVAVTSSAGTVIVPAGVGGDTRIPPEPGVNEVVALASDQYGNQGRTPPCEIVLVDIAINFAPPIADGLVGAPDGVVSGSTLTLDICGTVSEAGATVEVAINGGALQPATVTGTAWCLAGVSLTESPPAHLIEVTATAGPLLSTRSLTLVVDLTPPDPIGATFTAFAPTRQSIQLSWIAPSDGGATVSGYLVKIATVPLSDGNFDSTGTVLAGPTPTAPGTTQTLLVEHLDAGTDYHVGVAALDAAGNRSVAESLGPIVPDFDATGAIGPVSPADGDNGLGYQMARGDFNGDGYSDLAVAAPFKSVGGVYGVGTVYVYFGSATGLSALPDVTIEGVEAGGQFGNGLTAIQWGGDAADDLAIGAPYANNYNGRVYIFFGGAGFSAVTGPASANVRINGGGGGWFNAGFLGWSLASARFDADSNDDLVIGVVGGGNGNGGIAVLFGGTSETTITLDDTNPAGSGTATTLVIRDPNPAAYDFFGYWVYNLGRTEGPSDTRDDIGVAYLEGASAFVIRGRARPATAGVTLASFNTATDLQIQNDSTDADGAVSFGSAMGSIEDLNGDNARDVIIGSWAEGTNNGRVVIVDGNAVGTQSVAAIAITTITPGAGVRALGMAVVNNALADIAPDVNNDGQADLLIVGNQGNTPNVTMFIWYGGNIPIGSATTASADHIITAPVEFDAILPPSGGTAMTAIWAGDVNGDGLEDICWADHVAGGRDGAFELLWDDGM
jgi:hypothetical protein